MNSSRRIKAFLLGITILNKKTVTKPVEFPCLLGHPGFDLEQLKNVKKNFKNF